jgi:hypothetical protein
MQSKTSLPEDRPFHDVAIAARDTLHACGLSFPIIHYHLHLVGCAYLDTFFPCGSSTRKMHLTYVGTHNNPPGRRTPKIFVITIIPAGPVSENCRRLLKQGTEAFCQHTQSGERARRTFSGSGSAVSHGVERIRCLRCEGLGDVMSIPECENADDGIDTKTSNDGVPGSRILLEQGMGMIYAICGIFEKEHDAHYLLGERWFEFTLRHAQMGLQGQESLQSRKGSRLIAQNAYMNNESRARLKLHFYTMDIRQLPQTPNPDRYATQMAPQCKNPTKRPHDANTRT